MSSIFWYQIFVALSGFLGGEVPVVDNVLSSSEQDLYPTTSLDQKCKKIGFQIDRYYVNLRQMYLASKLKFVKCLGYETYETNKVEAKRRSKKRMRKRRRNKRPQFFVLLMQTKFCTKRFPMLMCTSTISKLTTRMDCLRASLTFPTTSMGPGLKTTTKKFGTARGTIRKTFSMKL